MNKWTEYCVSHPNLHLAEAFIDNTLPHQFWSLTEKYPDLVRHLRMQIRLWIISAQCWGALVIWYGLAEVFHV